MSVAKGFLAEIRVLPMSLMLLTCLLGGFFAGPALNWNVMGLVLLNAFLFLYTAHLNDTYWDLRNGEYESGRKLHGVRLNDTAYLPRWGYGYEIPNAPILPKNYYLAGICLCSAAGVLVMVYLSTILGWSYTALAIGGLILALTYSAGLDRIPALGDTIWEFGVLLAMWCGYYSQKLTIDPFLISTSIPLFVSLISIKALDSLPDTIVDHKRGKVTLTVYLYRKGLSLKAIRHIAYIPLYVSFTTLYFTLPAEFKPGTIAVILALLAQQLAFRNDEDGRISIVAVSFTILFFIAAALLKIAGLF